MIISLTLDQINAWDKAWHHVEIFAIVKCHEMIISLTLGWNCAWGVQDTIYEDISKDRMF